MNWLRVDSNSFTKSERQRIKWERSDLIDSIANLKLKRESLLSQKQAIQKDIVSTPALYQEKWDTVTKISASHETQITQLMDEISEISKSIRDSRIQIYQLERAISDEIAQRESVPMQFDFSDMELKIPKLAEVEKFRETKKNLNEWHLDRVYNAQLEISKFDHFNRKPSSKLGNAAASIAEDVNMTVRKGALSSHKMRAKVNSLQEKSCQLEEQVRVEESVVQNLRRERLLRENSRDKKISNTKACIRANLDTMKEEIIALNVTRRHLKQQNQACVAKHALLCEEIVKLRAPKTEEKIEKVTEEEEEEVEEVEDSVSMMLEELLVKQRISLEKDIGMTRDQIRKLRASSKHRTGKLKRQITRLWNIETDLRRQITGIIDNFH